MNGYCPWGLAAIGVVLIFVIFLLIFLRKTLSQIEGLITEVEVRLRTIDPALRAVGDIGEALEKHTIHLKRLSEITAGMLAEKKVCRCPEEKIEAAMGVADWIIGGLALWKRYKDQTKR